MCVVDLAFSITGQTLPVDHGYQVYSAISRLIPSLHAENGIGIHPIRGRFVGDRQMQLCDWSRLTLRLEATRIHEMLLLAGKQLGIAGRRLRVGTPSVQAIAGTPTLKSRLVTIKVADTKQKGPSPDAECFLDAVRRQLTSIGVSPEIPLRVPTRAGKPIRRTLRIKDKEIVGYELIVGGLNAIESLALQARGIGGRRHMGCGVFTAVLEPSQGLHAANPGDE